MAIQSGMPSGLTVSDGRSDKGYKKWSETGKRVCNADQMID